MTKFRRSPFTSDDMESSSLSAPHVDFSGIEDPMDVNAECDDWRFADVLGGTVASRDAILNHLRNLTMSSLNNYQEIAAIVPGTHLKSFVDVIVRQRSAQQRALYDKIQYLSTGDENEYAESRAILRSLWRLAILYLERNNHSAFLEYAERAEGFLEEAYLTAADSVLDAGLAQEIRDYALMVYGARTICEELADNLSGGKKLSADPGELEQVV